jgi:cytochrome c553
LRCPTDRPLAGKGRLRAAFLLVLAFFPASLPAQNAEGGRQKALACLGCHGENGNSTLPQVPILAGQTARYIYLQLVDFKEGRRVEPQMEPFVQPLSRDDMRELAAFFASQKSRSLSFALDEAKVRRGKSKSEEVLCTMCHLGGFAGQNEIPRIAGQHFEYTVKQLRDFKARKRTNDAGNMTAVARTLSEQDIEDLGHYLVSLQ